MSFDRELACETLDDTASATEMEVEENYLENKVQSSAKL